MRGNRAFTLVELIAVVAIASIFVGIAAPSLHHFVLRTKLSSSTNQWIEALYLARSRAIKSGRSVVVCKASDAACATTGDWSQGWMIFEDANHDGYCRDADADGTCDEDHGAITIVDHPFHDARISIVGNTHVARRIRFNPLGGTPGYNGIFTICGTSETGVQVVLHTTGRIRRRGSDSDCSR